MPGSYTSQSQYASTPEAQELLRRTLSGDFLAEQNPYMDEVIANANRDTTQALQGQLGNLSAASLRPGQFGSSVWQNQRQALDDAAAKRIADASTGARAATYEAERGRQNEALALQNQRDQAIWNDLTGRRGQDVSARNASASAGAARYSADLNAKAQEAATRANLLLGQGQLAENARQFDMQYPVTWAQLLGGQISDYGQQDATDFSQLLSGYGQQAGLQQGAVGLGNALAGMELQGQGQALQAAGMIPGFEQAGAARLGMAGDFLSQLYNTQAGLDAAKASANASRYATTTANNQFNNQMAYNSALNQWGYNNPQGALDDYLRTVLGVGGVAGGTTTGRGVGAPSSGQVVPGQQNPLGSLLQTGLGLGLMFGTGGAGAGAAMPFLPTAGVGWP